MKEFFMKTIIVRDLVLKVIGLSVAIIGFILMFITYETVFFGLVLIGILITIIGSLEV